MARRIKIENHYTLDEWQKLIPKVQNLEHRFRIFIIENILKNPNISSKEICDKFYITTNTFFRWLKWYNEGGLEKLKNGESGKGNKASS